MSTPDLPVAQARALPVLVSSTEAPASLPPIAEKAPESRVEQIRYALLCARTARNWLRAAGADKAADYQARAIKSVEGAERHAIRMEQEQSPWLPE